MRMGMYRIIGGAVMILSCGTKVSLIGAQFLNEMDSRLMKEAMMDFFKNLKDSDPGASQHVTIPFDDLS